MELEGMLSMRNGNTRLDNDCEVVTFLQKVDKVKNYLSHALTFS